jgi:hypothetical protein
MLNIEAILSVADTGRGGGAGRGRPPLPTIFGHFTHQINTAWNIIIIIVQRIHHLVFISGYDASVWTPTSISFVMSDNRRLIVTFKKYLQQFNLCNKFILSFVINILIPIACISVYNFSTCASSGIDTPGLEIFSTIQWDRRYLKSAIEPFQKSRKKIVCGIYGCTGHHYLARYPSISHNIRHQIWDLIYFRYRPSF